MARCSSKYDERQLLRPLYRKYLPLIDPVKRQVINLPENYLGVASRIAAMSWEMKFLKDRALLDSLLDRAAVQFTSGAMYADDALPTGRYDRYSNEYARYVRDAAQIAGRKALLDKLRPSLKAQMRLWWDLVGPDGYGYPWGRSLGLVSYLDTLEIPGFLALHPEFRPAPVGQLASQYYRAWEWLRRDFNADRHLFSLFDFGRGNFSYIRLDREWQQTTGSFGKLAHAHMQLMEGVRAEHVARFPDTPTYPTVAHFEFFANKSRERQAGVWVVRDGAMRFARCPSPQEQNRVSPIICRRRTDCPGSRSRSNKSCRRLCRSSSWRMGAQSSRLTARTRFHRPQMAVVSTSSGGTGRSSAASLANESTRAFKATSSGGSRTAALCERSVTRRRVPCDFGGGT